MEEETLAHLAHVLIHLFREYGFVGGLEKLGLILLAVPFILLILFLLSLIVDHSADNPAIQNKFHSPISFIVDRKGNVMITKEFYNRQSYETNRVSGKNSNNAKAKAMSA